MMRQVPSKVDKFDEKILAVNRNILFDNGNLLFQNILTNPELVSNIVENIGECCVYRRGDVEENFTLKQPITFTVIKRGDSIFMYKRLSGGGEARLHNSLSVGVGGHMVPMGDVTDINSIIRYNVNKEINEELHMHLVNRSFDNPYGNIERIGLINDDSNEVGMAHIGIYSIVTVSDESHVSVRETDTLEGTWVKIPDIMASEHMFGKLESWSKLVVLDLMKRFGYSEKVLNTEGDLLRNPVWQVLGIVPTQAQIDYIFNGIPMDTRDRRNGSTTAHIIKMCIMKGGPIDLNRPELIADRAGQVYAQHIFMSMFLKTYMKLRDAGIPVREIVYSRGRS